MVNVGIAGIEVYFPQRYVDQNSYGKKFTDGLGQDRICFTDQREDAISFALTVTSRLIKRYNIDVKQIGRLEVGTETIIDHSKSIKTYLMDLFKDNPYLEGCDNINACFGASQALFSCVDYVKAYNKSAIVVATDIAEYELGESEKA
jgi:hydroxymethylglutaryl-CoA synthase